MKIIFTTHERLLDRGWMPPWSAKRLKQRTWDLEEHRQSLVREVHDLRDTLNKALNERDELRRAMPVVPDRTYLTIAAIENTGDHEGEQLGVDWTVCYDHHIDRAGSITSDIVPLDWGTWANAKTTKEDAEKVVNAVTALAKNPKGRAATVRLSGEVDAYIYKLATIYPDDIVVEY